MIEPEAAPQSPPYTITVTWAVGDSLTVEYPDLQPWEAVVALRAAIDDLQAAEDSMTEEVDQ